MNAKNVSISLRKEDLVDICPWVLIIPIIATFNVVFEGGSVAEIALTLLSGLILGCVLGLRQVWSKRNPLEHEQSHIKLTMITSIILWTVFVMALGIGMWATGKADRQFLGSVALLLTAGQLLMIFLGAGWGVVVCGLDWYPLRRTRASVIRLVVLYLVALVLVGISGALMLDVPRWQWLLALTGIALVWLTIARLWRG